MLYWLYALTVCLRDAAIVGRISCFLTKICVIHFVLLLFSCVFPFFYFVNGGV